MGFSIGGGICQRGEGGGVFDYEMKGEGGGIKLWAWRLFSDCHGFPTFDDI